jgi:pimeloyl-ACP methyl ester carboxylesterase
MEALVLLAGLMCDARVFAPQIAGLSGRMTLILPPLAADRVEAVADTILTALPPRFALAGQGLGGIVALEMMRRAPARVTRLALIATTPLAEPPAAAAAREERLVAARAGRLAEMVGREYPPEALAPGPARARALAEVTAMAQGLGPAAYVAQSRLLQRRRDAQDLLRRIRQPALVLCGAHDQILPVKRHEMMAAMIPAARLTVLAGAGQLPSLEMPEAVTDALADWMTWPLLLR